MPLDLSRPLAWTQADAEQQQLLDDLQANILKGHGRRHLRQLFLQVDEPAGARAWLRGLADRVSSAGQALLAAEAHRREGRSGGPVLLVALSHAGYRALGLPDRVTPADPAFVAGLPARRRLLGDPPLPQWEAHLQRPQLLLLLADDSAARVQQASRRLLAGLPAALRCAGEQAGQVLASHHAPEEGIEHFGFVNGRSQPLMLAEDIERERTQRDGTSVWDPAFGPELVLVRDPGGARPTSHGSYLVLRKLAQHVRAFHAAEAALARTLALRGAERARAGAMMVGRFRDGTPLALQRAPGMHAPVPNNFDYLDDDAATKCPAWSHVRRCNPRGEHGAHGESIDHERAHLLVRRGMPYGQRSRPADAQGQAPADLPRDGEVGLLFMAYQRDIGNQFEHLQARWANARRPLAAGPAHGIDPLAGQAAHGGQRACPHWGASGTDAARTQAVDLHGFVTMRGGGYFFAPSISMLRGL